MLTPTLRDVLARRPVGLVFDIDGTLSPIASIPSAARLYPGVAPLLERIRKHARLAIMTGRSIDDAAAIVQVDDVSYIGNHGMEWSNGLPANHAVQIVPEALAHVESAKHLLDLVEQQLMPEMPGIFVQRKHVGGSVHYRLCSDPEVARQRIRLLLEEPAQRANLRLSDGKMVVDVQVPGMNKGEALRLFVQRSGVRGVVFAGDDRTDLDAVLEIGRLRERGIAAFAIVVQHSDTLPELLARGDLLVQEVEGMYALLREIAGALSEEA